MIHSKREAWLDYIRILACILVALGHFFQSMVRSDIMGDTALYEWFNTTIYYFHVPLFFICSGYLYQKLTKIHTCKDWLHHVEKKLLALGIPYLVFQSATWLLKTVFSSSVNGQTNSLFYHLFVSPLNQFWFLYALFFIFLVTPGASRKSRLFLLAGLALLLKIIYIYFLDGSCPITPINYICGNEIWFVTGMVMQYLHFTKIASKFKMLLFAVSGTAGFMILSIILFSFDIQTKLQGTLLCFLICLSLSVLAIQYEHSTLPRKLVNQLAKYTLPIYLMHTLFAATCRAVLLKLGFTGLFIHCLTGISISFIGPILAMLVAEKLWILDFCVYPTKYIKITQKN